MSDLIADYLRHLRNLGRATATIETYGVMLRALDRHLPAGLTSACTDELVTAIYTDDRSNATRALRRAAVTGFFAWACDEDEPQLDYNPARKLPAVRVKIGKPRPVQPAELAAILTRAEWPYRGWFLLASHAGARCVEISQLDREDITERSLLLHGKGDQDRAIPTHPLIWQYAQRMPPGPIAVSRDGRIDRKRVSLLGNAQLDRLGFPGVTMHRLRHSFLTRAFDACKDIRAVQRLAGHASINTTQIYVEVNEASMRRAVDGLAVVA